ncbi:MAG: 3-deoxy-7-phosphoheptulonate synthase [Kiritimatiellae bacterium]|nr:3-deoxy-7-phosphoheptulonate synthase [Kiritimatiellia bacterium]
MIIKLNKNISDSQKEQIHSALKVEGVAFSEISPSDGDIIIAKGRAGLGTNFLNDLAGIEELTPDKTSFKLVSRENHPEDTLVKVGPVTIGGERIVVISGPCAVESHEQTLSIAKEIKKYGATILRGGAFKPRSSPYSFQGLEEDGLKILADVREETGMPIATEMTAPSQADMMMKYVDMIQIGARNMQNFELLKCVGALNKPVMLKRGLSATIEEWLMSAEYIMAGGNTQVVICERGIRTYEPYTRNTLDLSAIPIVKNLTHLPILIDPSHATGIREKVAPMARAAIAAGADALMIEVHNNPAQAASDGAQSLFPEQFGKLMRDIYVIAPVVNKQVDFGYLEKSDVIDSTDKSDGQKLKAVFQGAMGAPDHKASRQYFGEDVELSPLNSTRQVIEHVTDGKSDYGLIPLEHSMSGSVHENYDLVIENKLHIIGEITLRIEYALAAAKGVTSAQITSVTSSPTAFHHCDKYMETRNDWQLLYAQDTATAANQVEQCKDKTSATITTKEAADMYGLEIIEEGIETSPRNYTRFAVIAKEQQSHGPKKKSSIIYQTPDKPGALLKTLSIFAEHNVNLLKLESRPVDGRPWEYMFYVDIEAAADDDSFSPVLDALKEHTDYLHILGVY